MADFDRRRQFQHDVCAAWLGPRPVVLEPLAGAGFSGATVILVRCPDTGAAWVLKSIARRDDAPRVAWIHSLMRHLRASGLVEVPEVAVTTTGASLVVGPDAGAWELVAFVAGTPAARPTLPQASAAAACLARIHRAAATLPGATPQRRVPAAEVRRVEQAAALLAAPWSGRIGRRSTATIGWHDEVVLRLDRAAAVFSEADGARALARVAARRPTPMRVQAVLRDVGCEHVLYRKPAAPDVAGVIDFHAAAIDTPATDLARLLGSWLPARDHDRRAAALAAYEALRPLEADERAAVPWLQATGVIFGLDNWFRWTLGEGRDFADPAAVIARIDALLDRLPESVVDLHDHAEHAV